ncbi:universal stress protein PHOS32-like [Durio zibethinus]|uniref:Universal stress protein PHOS32-like n=1 Tax=Durio zibethinus TaxID=66656 RepID=A0A6P6BHX2_DURZI|nr:universal stress protein PHOS32-like [Durio zibethinus]
MGRTGTRLPGFCLNRIRPHVRVRSPPIQAKPDVNSTKTDQKDEICGKVEEDKSSNGEKPGLVIGRKIMIVVDSSIEAKGAIQWALSHTVQCQDTVILLYVTKSSKQVPVASDESDKNSDPRTCEPVSSLKNMCKQKRPEVEVEVAVVQGTEKGPTIVEEAKKQGVSLLVLGQKKKSMTWRLIMMWAGNRVTGGVVEYCIQNASCMAVAVRRKSKKLGGYLITTKRHKDFWLLA